MKIKYAVLSLCAFASAIVASAQTAAPTKIAMIAFQAAIAQTNEGQRALTDVQKKLEPKLQQLKTQNEEIANLQKQLSDPSAKLTPQESARQKKVIDGKKKQLQREAQDFRASSNSQVQQALAPVGKKVYAVMVDYAKSQGFTLVIDATRQKQSEPFVIYGADSVDIGKAVIDAYNVKSGVPPPVLPKAPAK